MTEPFFDHLDTPVGRLRIVAHDHALLAVMFPDDSARRRAGADASRDRSASPRRATAVIDATRRQLDEYFAGTRTRFDLPLAPEGTAFHREVWAALCAIPFAETIAYGEVAHRIGRPGAARAVGLANGRNPVAIIVPCHRVIGADGSLTGYGGGMPRKRWLLEHERAIAGHGATLALFTDRPRDAG